MTRLALVCLVLGLGCKSDPKDPLREELGRCADFDPLRQPFFGDTHVHTRLSLDANLQGNRLSPLDAYRFARGEEVGIQPYDAEGNPLRRLRLSRPLDFVAISDHAEFLGLVQTCLDPSADGYDSRQCVQYRDDPDAAFVTLNFALTLGQGRARSPEPCADRSCAAAEIAAWDETREAAEAAYDRSDACTFTTFVAYEWSGNPGASNLHRNVIFRNHVVPDEPLGYFDTQQEEVLWSRLEDECIDASGICDALSIPHNSNLSSGLMFETVDQEGQPFDADYARLRARLEPLAEVFQHKGSSECLPGPMGGDELCDFELLPYRNLATANLGGPRQDPVPSDFLRDALATGMRLESELGVNPFQLGFIASTDTHLGTPGAVEEDNFQGHGGAGLAVRDALPVGLPDRAWFNPGGLAVLWAEENSREALFEAMRRREAYGTSGTRIVLRFFGGWGYPDDLCGRSDLVRVGYDGGVPMGGVLGEPAGDGPPRFVVSAMRDAESVPLAAVQIVKGWLEGGEPRWQVFDVAGALDNGATVDPATCVPRPAGSDSLCAVWEDPSFVADQPAVYYARVLEDPTCRWQAYYCNAAGVDCDDPTTVTEGYEGCCEEPPIQRERAWSSPIWFGP